MVLGVFCGVCGGEGDAIVPVVMFQSSLIQSPKLARPSIRVTSRCKRLRSQVRIAAEVE